MSLDNTLREILRDGAMGNYTKDSEGNFVELSWAGSPDSYFDDYIEQIKQAFTEAGYYKMTGTQEQQAALANMMLGNKVMTGTEFYNRFEKELASGAPTKVAHWEFTGSEVLKAARIAAGVTK